MAKFLFLSILVATLMIPMRLARTPNVKLGLRKVVTYMVLYIFAWVGFCVYLFLKMGGGT